MIKKIIRRSIDMLLGDLLVKIARHKLERLGDSAPYFRAAVIPPAVCGSVGDAAMISATFETLRDLGFRQVDFLSGESGELWPLDSEPDTWVAASSFFYQGNRVQQARLLWRLGRYSHLFFIGADVLDGAYNPWSVARRLSLLHAAAGIGRHATILGCSFNSHPDPLMIATLRDLPQGTRINARDPVSAERMRTMLQRPVAQAADVAFLVKPRPDHPDAARAGKWIAARRAKTGGIVALNANYLQFAKQPSLLPAYIATARALLDYGASLLLVPHDNRTEEPDLLHLQRIAAAVAQPGDERIHILDTISPGAVKATLGQVDLLVTGRLHAMILGMGAGTPSIGLAYQGKFEGLFELFDLPVTDFLFDPEAFAADPAALIARAGQMLGHSSDTRARIVAKLPRVTKLSLGNFD